uniref:EF-hand domain-containing protein n=1 Tax=Macaca fascicularis TaxID=9541 RepID=A0A7N9IC35_MACFA
RAQRPARPAESPARRRHAAPRALAAPGPRPAPGAGLAGPRLRLRAALAVQEAAEGLPAGSDAERRASAPGQQPKHSDLLLPQRTPAGLAQRGCRHQQDRERLCPPPPRESHHGRHGPGGQGLRLPLYWKGPLFCGRAGSARARVRPQVRRHVEKNPPQLPRRRGQVRPSAHEPWLQLPGAGRLRPLPAGRGEHAPGAVVPEGGVRVPLALHHTVIQRIFYTVNRSWSGRITAPAWSLPANVALLEEEADINQLTEFFSYEHFYVIYCKFWELDTDHDLLIDAHDLARHNDHAISTKMIDRIFSGAVTRGRKAQKEGEARRLCLVLISEEDKKTTSIEYWFRCMDLDGDGALSMFELEYFYEEQCRRLDSMAIEALPFQDCLCQMLDLVKPRSEGEDHAWDPAGRAVLRTPSSTSRSTWTTKAASRSRCSGTGTAAPSLGLEKHAE